MHVLEIEMHVHVDGCFSVFRIAGLIMLFCLSFVLYKCVDNLGLQKSIKYFVIKLIFLQLDI